MNAGIYITVWLWVGGCRYLVVGRFVWKTTPSEARVTRDEVSGLKQKEGEAVWKTVPCRCMLIAFFICFGTVFQTAFFVIPFIPRLRPGLLSLFSVLAFSQSYLQPTTPNQ